MTGAKVAKVAVSIVLSATLFDPLRLSAYDSTDTLRLEQAGQKERACDEAVSARRYTDVISACTITARGSEERAKYDGNHIRYFVKRSDLMRADNARRNRDVSLLAAAEKWILVIVSEAHLGNRAESTRLTRRTRDLVGGIYPGNLVRTDALEKSHTLKRYEAIRAQLAGL